MPFELGLPEVLLVLAIALLVLGPKRLPEAGNAIGRGIREFRSAVTGDDTAEPERPAAELPPTAYTPPPAYVPPPQTPAAVYTPPPARGEQPDRPAD